MKIMIGVGLLVFLLLLLMSSCGTIETGNVGVRTSWNGKINETEENPGFYVAMFSSVEEYSAREITVTIENMRPKAKDNLSLADMDLELFYQTKPEKIAELNMKYANRNAKDKTTGVYYPAYHLVLSIARETTYAAVARYDSLEIHKFRDALKDEIHKVLQKKLNEDDPGTFIITKVIIRNIRTDESVENSIKLAVAKSKELEAKRKEVEIAREQAKVYMELDRALTFKVLEQQRIQVMEKAIENNKNTTIILGTTGTPFINIK